MFINIESQKIKLKFKKIKNFKKLKFINKIIIIIIIIIIIWEFSQQC